MKIKNVIKKILIHLRTSIKVISLTVLATSIILGTVAFVYKPTYAVSIKGEFVGYTQDKSKLQTRINEYIETGEGENVAFVQVNDLPEYQLCLLKKNIETNDEQIYQMVKQNGVQYYKYYAILESGEEKLFVASFEEAEKALNGLKEKNSTNKEQISIVEKYEVEPKDIVDAEKVISELYKKPEEVVVPKKAKTSSGTVVAAKGINETGQKVALGISLTKPVSGVVTSRFGARWGKKHKGIDIGAPKGTKIKAASAGTVTVSSYGYNGGYGNYVMIRHGNGVETLYGHCSELYAKVGQKVNAGDVIAAVGNTGNSQGNHLHLEIRVNNVAQNPQNYLYQ